jgi:ubiquinone/menaquinone biosynthesis C-methylase UbiE
MEQRDHAFVTDVIRFHWNARAETFETTDRHNAILDDRQHRAWQEQVASWAGPPPRRVLDVGCGTGVLSLIFAELGHRVTGVDFAAKMLALAQEKAKLANLEIDFRLQDAANLSDPDETYDVVIGRHVIWTLPDPMRALAEWARVLRPNGRLILIESTFAEKQARPAQKQPAKSITETITDAGLTAASYILGRKNWRLYSKQYRQIRGTLPFSGGAPADRLVESMQQMGLRDTSVEPLMSAELWGETPPYPRYAVIGTAK